MKVLVFRVQYGKNLVLKEGQWIIYCDEGCFEVIFDIWCCLNENIFCLGVIIYELSNGYEVFLFFIIYFQFWYLSLCFIKL